MKAHAEDLRSEGADEELVAAIAEDWRSARLSAQDSAMLEYAEKLALTPAQIAQADVDALRAAGFTDRAISDIVQVVAYFSYINLVADGIGVDPEPESAAR
ncbi:MAG: peroxidase-related enzyme [Armatimonadota bacterium]